MKPMGIYLFKCPKHVVRLLLKRKEGEIDIFWTNKKVGIFWEII